jgi:hypothetical protein
MVTGARPNSCRSARSPGSRLVISPEAIRDRRLALGRKYSQAARVFEDAWDAFTPFLAFSPTVRRLLYTTNAIESGTTS